MNEQFKQDLKAAVAGAMPIFKSIAIKAGMLIVGLMWAMFLIYFLCTMFWVFVIQVVLTIAVAVVWFKYCEIVDTRESEERYARRRGY